MASAVKPDRFKSYKTRGLDVEEVRRRKGEEGVQLRRNRREEQIAKRRNIKPADFAEPETDDSHEQQKTVLLHEGLSILELAQVLYSSDIKEKLAATVRFRKLLSVDLNPPIVEVIQTGSIPKFVEFLSVHSVPVLQFEAAWVLTNLASGSSIQTQQVIQAGAVPLLVGLFQSPVENIREQAVWAVGNIAGDSPECRDVVLGCGAMDALLELMGDAEIKPSVQRNAAWTLSNLCRGKNPHPDINVVSKCIPMLSQLLYSEDLEILADSCWVVAFLSDGPNQRIQRVIDGGLSRRLVELLFHLDRSVVTPALRAVGNIVTGDDVQTQVMINCSILPALHHLLSSPHDNIVKEACWALSNITAGNRVQIQAVIDNNIFPTLIGIMDRYMQFKTRKEAAWAVLNATSGGTAQQTRYLVSIGCIKPLCSMLTMPDSRVILVTLEGLENILKVGQQDLDKNGGINPHSVLIEEAYGLDKLEALQNHNSEKIYKMAFRIIEKYFSADDEVDSTVEPQQSPNRERFMFSNTSATPQGGFHF